MSAFVPFYTDFRGDLGTVPKMLSVFMARVLTASMSFIAPLADVFSVLTASLAVIPNAHLELRDASVSALCFFTVSARQLLEAYTPDITDSDVSSWMVSLDFLTSNVFLKSTIGAPSASIGV